MEYINLRKEENKEDILKSYKALNQLKEKEQGIGMVGRCYSAVVHDELEELYKKRNGVKKTRGSICHLRLLGKHCKISHMLCKLPAEDHPNLWIKDGQPYSFTFEPYGISHENLVNLTNYCEENNLKITITNDSFHFPSATLLVEIKKEVKTKGDNQNE